jgi:REP element-mobilizing transposase RayT
MQQLEYLVPGNYYHIYNRGINSCNLFTEPDNYEYFLSLYDKYISSIADTYAWVLMPNHFHFLVRLKDEMEVATTIPDRFPKPVRCDEATGCENLPGVEVEVKPPHQHFSNLFNAYTKAFNKRNDRHGSLFERPFKRKIIENEWYLKQVILYIHNNPVHHGFCSHPVEYPWSSYLTCISVKPTKLYREQVMGWFDSQANFKYMHEQKVQVEQIERWLDI